MYYNSINYEISDLKDKSKLFSILINPDNYKYPPSWDDIIKKIQFFYEKNEHNRQEWKSYISDNKDFELLESVGLNYDYIDNYDHNFLHYIFIAKKSKEKELLNIIGDKPIQYVLKKTSNVGQISLSDQNILFHYTAPYISDVKAENFLKLCAEYPELSIHQVNSQGNNLINKSLMEGNINLANVLIENNVSVTHINKNNRNLLWNFLFLGCGKETKKLFSQLLLQIDIGYKKGKDENLIETWCDWISAPEVKDPKKYNEWLEFTFKKISKGEFLYDKKSLDNLIKSLSKCEKKCNSLDFRNKFPDVVVGIREAKVTAQYIKMTMILPEKSLTSYKKMKI
jgi:hypothetical protein